MATAINWTANIQVAGGPKFAINGSQAVEAYEVIDVSIPDTASLPSGDTATKVTIQPTGGSLTFLLITADSYAADLSYTVDADTTDRMIDAPQLLIGPGATSLLDTGLTSLSFKHNSSDPVSLKILVGRDATP